MSGHSKWATIKHKKGAADKARGKLFAKLARQIEVAAKSGGDVETNAPLRTIVQKAKQGQMTKDAIDRAIKRGSGEADGANYESIMYEGYAPGGVAMLVDVLTDNRNRTAADVRMAFSKFGGAMAEPGAVGWQFSRKGVIYVSGLLDEDVVMTAALEAGAEDVEKEGEMWKVLSEPSVVYDIQEALVAAGIEVQSAESTMVCSTTIEVSSVDDAKQILRIMDMLEENDDVQDVFSNFDIEESLMQELG